MITQGNIDDSIQLSSITGGYQFNFNSSVTSVKYNTYSLKVSFTYTFIVDNNSYMHTYMLWQTGIKF
jgi:hypothetical protein